MLRVPVIAEEEGIVSQKAPKKGSISQSKTRTLSSFIEWSRKMDLIGNICVTLKRPKIVKQNFTQLKLEYYLIIPKKLRVLVGTEGEGIVPKKGP